MEQLHFLKLWDTETFLCWNLVVYKTIEIANLAICLVCFWIFDDWKKIFFESLLA